MDDADLDIIARDSALPGLHLLFDPSELLTVLRRLPALQDIQSADIEYLRYKPGTSCTCGLVITRNHGKREHFYLKALTRARFEQSWNHPKRQALLAKGTPYGPLALPDAAIMLLHPAHDRAIRYLDILQDDMKAQALFHALLPDVATNEKIEWRFLRYKPERRCVIGLIVAEKIRAVLRCGNSNEFGSMLIGATVGAALEHLQLLSPRGNRRMLLTGWIDGKSLDPEHDAKPTALIMEATGKALARLHETPFSLPNTKTKEDTVQAMWRVFATLDAIYPKGGGKFHQLATEVARHIQQVSNETVLVHGDFSADQVINSVKRNKLHIIDWDHCASGNPLLDIASFQARFELQVITKLITRTYADIAIAAFLQGYCASRSINKAALPWYCAAALLGLAVEPFRIRATKWPLEIDAILNRVSELIFSSTTGALSDGLKDKKLIELTNPALMNAPLVKALKLPQDSKTVSCQVKRYKPGRRGLIEYEIDLPDGRKPFHLLGKYRCKSADRHGFMCQNALWENGFDGKTGISVPRPYALLKKYHLWLQEKIEGKTLTDALSGEDANLADLGRLVGKALACLHQNSGLKQVIDAKIWTADDELAVLNRGLLKVGEIYPQWQTRLQKIMDASEELAATLFNTANVPVHRDFYSDQVMIADANTDHLILLDFDLCALSPAALDAGNYLAHIRELALRQTNNITALIDHEHAFRDAFLNHSPATSERAVAGFTILSLTRHIYLSTQFPTRTHTTPALLEICENALQCWSKPYTPEGASIL